MRTSPTTWILAGLFVLFGLPLAVISDPWWRHICGGIATMSLGGFAVSLAADAARQGQLKLQHLLISRTARPLTFKLITGGIAICGLIVITTGIWMMTAKLMVLK